MSVNKLSDVRAAVDGVLFSIDSSSAAAIDAALKNEIAYYLPEEATSAADLEFLNEQRQIIAGLIDQVKTGRISFADSLELFDRLTSAAAMATADLQTFLGFDLDSDDDLDGEATPQDFADVLEYRNRIFQALQSLVNWQAATANRIVS